VLAFALSALVASAVAAGCGGDAPPADSWPKPDADYANTRRAGGPIDAASVRRLHVAWRVPLKGGYATTPVVVDGVAYAQDLESNVYAIDVRSGRLRWFSRVRQTDVGPNGVSVADGRVYGVVPRGAFALDQRTGRQLWGVQLIRTGTELVLMTPGEKDGTVYVSTAPADGESVGTLFALDGKTGRPLWHWEEVPSSLWGHPEVNGGGGLWHPPAFDERGALYIAIGNPMPFPGIPEAPWGSSRPGPNRWDNSLVKLDAHTGRFIWGTQVLPHDLYDWDLECPPILARAHGRRVVLSAGKMGFVYAFDADSGKLLWKRSVGIHNGHDDDDLLAMHGDYARLRLNQVMYPGGWGGVETPMASDGTTVYVPVNNLSWTFHTMEFGGRSTRPDPITGRGELVAIDIATGRIKWDTRLPHSPYGAATIANDLVFTTTYDGTLSAFDRRSGKPVWRSKLPTGTDAPVAIAGDTLITAASIPLTRSSKPQIVAYRLTR
jgi:outer membrane protein assembly factor BamB